MINPTTHAITEFAIPTANSDPSGITAGPDGNLWFTEADAGKIGEINPTTHAITEFPIPYANANPVGITAGPDGNLWFTDDGTNSIGVDTLNTHALRGDAAAADQRHRGHPLRPDGPGRGQLGQPRLLLQRHGDGGAGEQPRRRDARRHALRDGDATAWPPSPT